MKKTFTILIAALMLLTMMVLPGRAVGQTRDTKTDVMYAAGFADYTNNSYSAAGTDRTAVANSINATGVTYAMQVFNGYQGTVRGNQSGAANYSCRNTTTYNDYYISSVTLTITGGTLKKSNGRSLVYFGSSAYANPNTTAPTGTSTTASLSSDSKTLTWTNTDESVSHFILYNLETSGNCYSADANSPLTVVWTSKTPASSVATPQLSKGTSYCDEAQSITITCDTEDATIHYTLDGSAPTSTSTTYSGAISITETKTLRAIAIKNEASSAEASATYTFVSTLTTMDDIYAAATAAGGTATTVYIHFNNFVISAINSGSPSTVAYLTDGSKGCYINVSGHGFTAGKVLNGIVSCTLKKQYEMAWITGLTASSEGLMVTDGGTITPVVSTINALGGTNAGSLVTIKDLTWNSSETTFSDGTYTIKLSNAISNQSSLLTNGQVFDITGVFDMADGPVKRINPRSSNDVVEGPTTLPFNWAGGGKNALMALQGVTAYSLGADYADANAPYLVKFDGNGDYILVRTDSQPDVVTIDVKKIGGGGTSKITVQASTDGVTFDEGEELTISGSSNAIVKLTSIRTFNADVRYVKLYFTKGDNVGVGPISITKPSAEPSIIVEATKDIAYKTTSGSIEYEINNPVGGGELTATSSESWLTIGTVTLSAVPFTCSANNTNTPRSATVTLTYTYSGSKATKTATVEVTQSGTPRYYALAKSIIPGNSYIITNGSDKAMGQQNSNNRAAVGVSIINGIATVTNNDVYEFVVNTTLINDETYYTFYDERYNADEDEDLEGGYLYAQGSNNYLRTQEDLTQNGKWSIEIDNDGIATIKSQTTGDRDWMRYNNINDLFSCYKDGQNDIYLYMKVDTYLTADGNWNDGTKWIEGTIPTSSNDVAINAACTIPTSETAQARNIIIAGSPSSITIEDGGQLKCNNSVAATFQKNIAACPADDSDQNWYLISSPVGQVNTSFVTTGHSYNLYKYNEATAHWNGNGGSNEFSTLDKGIGYLYRKADDDVISFEGTLTCGDVSGIDLYNTNYDLPGFNLLGNPYSHNINSSCITLTENGAEFTGAYTLSTTGAWTAEVETGFRPCEGFLVQVNQTTKATIHETPQSKDKYNTEYIRFNVANSQYEDAAFAMFEKGFGLNKINHRNADVPMLYIPQNGQDYAIAMMSDDTKSFNLNFKAATMGQYTLSYKANGEYNYIHVIDRLTGADVDMLLEGEYSFVASPADNEARFIVKLSYMPDYGEGDSDIFAYQSGSSILVSGEGELQIFDVTGRNVMTTTINGAETINGLNAGVYIFRLNEKAQKIVVR